MYCVQEQIGVVMQKLQYNRRYVIDSFLGANACVQLQRYEEAISWCEKGLPVSFKYLT